MKRFIWLLIMMVVFMVGCSSKNSEGETPKTEAVTEEPKTDESKPEETKPETEPVDYSVYPQAVITMHTGETMTIALMPEYAPNTVNNFIELAESGFYNGLIFHRVIEDFMIQGGDPLGTGTGGPGYAIKGEFTNNGFEKNTLSHKRGVVSMARSQQNDSAGSQFFICHADSTYLDGQYAAFGQLIDGDKVLDRIALTPTGKNDVPNTPEQIKSITITRNGYELKAVEKIEEKNTKALDDAVEKALPFALGTPVKDVMASWGEYDSFDYLLGGLYYKYDEKDVLFFSNGFKSDKGIEYGEVLGIAFFETATFLDIATGTSFDEVIKVMGKPTSTVSPENNQDSELYGGGWTLNYESKKYMVTFSSIGDEKVVDSMYVFKK